MLADVDGLDVVELGCGTAYFSAWLARRGARPVGVDVTPAQLETARRLPGGDRRRVPAGRGERRGRAAADASFDLALSEYGASIWCDPYRWMPEACAAAASGRPARRSSATATLVDPLRAGRGAASGRRCSVRSAGCTARVAGRGGVEFHLGHGEHVPRCSAHRLRGRDLVELFAPDDATDHEYYDFVTADWARKWPVEEIWRGEAACSPLDPRVDVAAAARDPRAARDSVRGRPARVRRGGPARRRCRRARPRARRGQGALGSRRRDARPLGVDTTVLLDGARLRQAGGRDDAGRMLARARGPDARGGLGRLPAHARRGGARPRPHARDLPHARRRATSTRTSRAASGRDAPARTPSRASAAAWSSGSRATTSTSSASRARSSSRSLRACSAPNGCCKRRS